MDAPTYSIAQIAQRCGGRMAPGFAQGAEMIRGVETLANADATQVSWIASASHRHALTETRAGAVIGKEADLEGFVRGIIVADPEAAIATILEQFQTPLVTPAIGVHPTALVDATARLGRNVAIGARVCVGPGAEIGDNTILFSGVDVGARVRIGTDCVLHSNCVVYDRSELGNRVILHAGAVIGADGFGYIFREGRHRKVPQIGIVVIEDDVEIGANSCVDRAKVGATRIGRGSKIDNLVQVAHNVQLGQGCILVSQTGVAGSSRLGNGVVMGGQSGVIDGLTIGDRVQIAAKTAVFKDVPAGQVVVGTPARDRNSYFRNEVRINRLASLYDQVAELKNKVAEIERKENHRPPDLDHGPGSLHRRDGHRALSPRRGGFRNHLHPHRSQRDRTN